MKLAKLMRVKLSGAALLFIVLLASACKKDKSSPEVAVNTLQGNWQDEELTPGIKRSLKITQDSIFLIFQYLPYNDKEFFYLTGTYKVKGDSLLTNFKESITKRDNIVVSRVTIYGQVLDKATFKVNNNTLALKYTTYPADAPVATKATFTKVVN